MLSTALELLGLATLAAATYVLGGLAPTLFVAAAELLFLGWATSAPSTPSLVRRAVEDGTRLVTNPKPARGKE